MSRNLSHEHHRVTTEPDPQPTAPTAKRRNGGARSGPALRVEGPAAARPSVLLHRLLGAGGMGKVYQGRHARYGAVAVKRVSRSQAAHLKCLRNEFRAMSGIRHPALIRHYELLGHAEEEWLVMEHIAGRSLQQWLRSETTPAPTSPTSCSGPRTIHSHSTLRPLDWCRSRRSRICDLFLQIAQGLHHLHEQGWMHRDLKPENVMIETKTQRAVIVDMGIAVRCAQVAAGDYVSGGTLVYLAPELLRPGGQPSFGSDWYAFGLMLYEAVTGVLQQDLALSVLGGAPPPPRVHNPALDEELAALCVDLLQPAPHQRAGAAQVFRVLSRREARAELSWIA